MLNVTTPFRGFAHLQVAADVVGHLAIFLMMAFLGIFHVMMVGRGIARALVALIVDTRKYEHVENEETAADGDCDAQGS